MQCTIDGCEKRQKANGYCLMHYARMRRHGTPDVPQRRVRSQCSIEGCGKLCVARQLCDTHYRQWKRKEPPPQINEETRVPCSIPECDKRHHAGGYCEAHYRLWKRYGTPEPDTSYGKGHITTGGYRKICINGRMIFEHRHVMEVVLGRPLERTEVVHHKDHNKLNNVPENLEVLTQSDHMHKHGGRQKLPTTTSTHRRCPQCGLSKLHAEFGTTTRRSYCFECWNTYYSTYRLLHPRDASTFRRG